MPARALLWGLNASIALTALLFVAAFAIVAVAPLAGEPLHATWSVAGVVDESSAQAGVAQLSLEQGSLVLVGVHSWLWALMMLDVVVMGLLALAVLVLLRRFALRIRDEQPFDDRAARRLQCIAWLMIAWTAWQALHSGLAQVWLLAHSTQVAPGIDLLHSLAPAQPGAVRILVDLDLAPAIAGLVLLVIARAFAHGIEQRRSLDEIV